jgi:ATP-dependent metalloprotease FtsH
MRYSEKVRDILLVAKKAVALTDPSAIKEKAPVIGWSHLAAAACSTKTIDVHLANIMVLQTTEVQWPLATGDFAAKLTDQPPVTIPLCPTSDIDALFQRIKGSDVTAILELSDLARVIWEGAPAEWKESLCSLNNAQPPSANAFAKEPTPKQATTSRSSPLAAAYQESGNAHRQLKQAIVGQSSALSEIAKALFHSKMQIADTPGGGRKAVWTFVGPPGVGKTYTARKLGEVLGEKTLEPIDVSSYGSAQEALEDLFGSLSVYRGSKAGRLTNILDGNPNAFLVFDSIEQSFPEVLNAIFQMIELGYHVDRNSQKKYPCNRANFVFTTSAGRAIYEDYNRTGLIFDSPKTYHDTILDALDKEKDRHGGVLFSPAVRSRLGGGALVLFRPLPPLDYVRLLDIEVEEINRSHQATCGFRVVCSEENVKALLVLHSGPDLDARRVKDSLAKFVDETIYSALASDSTSNQAGVSSFDGIERFELRISPNEECDIIEALQKNCRSILIVDDRRDLFDLYRQTYPEFKWWGAANVQEACEVLRRQKVDWVLQDLDLRGVDTDQVDVESGLTCLGVLNKQFPRLPIFILSRALTEARFDEGLYDRCIQAGGARGYLEKAFSNNSEKEEAKQFRCALERVRSNLARERLVHEMVRSRKRVVFDAKLNRPADGKAVHCNLYNVRYETVPTSGAFTQFAIERPKTRFSDVAGNDAAMKELRLVVEWLREPDRFGRLGAPIPRGVLMVGPPGTGKTLLARAVAGEAEVPFIPAKASEFTTIWQASGATAIRDLFSNARKHAPSIVFIDEIDTVGSRRDSGMDSHGERRQALTQLLTEMDGFSRSSDNPPVIVLAATNRAEDLDEALKRPGRFDRVVDVGLPDLAAREKILRLHARNKGVGDINWHRLAQRTTGCSGADLERIVNEALTLATLADKDTASQDDFNEAVNRLRMGSADEGKEKTSADKSLVAAHEAGHAVALKALFPARPIPQVTIVGRRSAGGFVERTEAEGESRLPHRAILLAEITVMMAGRAAEEVLRGMATPGASEDIKAATSLAVNMVAKWGLSEEIGLLSVEGVAGRFSEQRQAIAETAVQKLLGECAQRAKALIETNKAIAANLQALLEEKETLLEEEIDIFWTQSGCPTEDQSKTTGG